MGAVQKPVGVRYATLPIGLRGQVSQLSSMTNGDRATLLGISTHLPTMTWQVTRSRVFAFLPHNPTSIV
jgi:hypothetical protein